jgi:hypothetical protein
LTSFCSGFISIWSERRFTDKDMKQSQKYHLENPYWKTFDPYVKPLLERPMDLRRHEELDTSKDVEVPA